MRKLIEKILVETAPGTAANIERRVRGAFPNGMPDTAEAAETLSMSITLGRSGADFPIVMAIRQAFGLSPVDWSSHAREIMDRTIEKVEEITKMKYEEIKEFVERNREARGATDSRDFVLEKLGLTEEEVAEHTPASRDASESMKRLVRSMRDSGISEQAVLEMSSVLLKDKSVAFSESEMTKLIRAVFRER